MRTIFLILLACLVSSGAAADGQVVKKDTPTITWDVDTGSSVTNTTALENYAGRLRRMFFVVPDLTGGGTVLTASLVTQPEGISLWSKALAENTTTDVDYQTTGVFLSGVTNLTLTVNNGQATSPSITVVFFREAAR